MSVAVDDSVPPSLHGDPDRVWQILMNIVGNAVKFTEQGSVEVHGSSRTEGEKIYLRFEVRDSGPGIEPLLAIGRRRFDLVISDLRMPSLDGVRLLEMNAAKGLHVPIIVVSAVAPEEAEQRCLELGAVDYLTKPIRKDVLLLRVRRALAAARPQTGSPVG